MESISKSRRKQIRKAMEQTRAEVTEVDIDKYWDFFVKAYEMRGRIPNYSKSQFSKLIKAAVENDAVKVCNIIDDNQKIISENIFLYDSNRTYDQFGCHMPETKVEGKSYGIYTTILNSMYDNKVFDFEGSMIRGVCEFNASFNPVWEIEYRIENYSNRYIVVDSLRRIFVVIKKSIEKQIRGGMTL